jgi:uncharacterized damage-inducible protein DinB
MGEVNMDAPEDRVGAIARFREGPAQLANAVMHLRDVDLDAMPSAGGWSIRQIVHHVADGDDIWKLGIKMAIGNDQAEFVLSWYWTQTQKAWADHWAYSNRSIGTSLALLKASREHVLQLLESAPESWNRAVVLRTSSGEIERIPVGYVVQMQGDHLFQHLERIRAILCERGHV